VRLDRLSQKLAVDVIDTGIGIPPEIQQVLFRPFTQGDSSVTRRFGGTGLGLSICRSIVKGLGGSIQVVSQFGQGSTFSFNIETGSLDDVEFRAQPPKEIELEDSVGAKKLSLKSIRILVAEDGDSNRRLIQLILSRAGAEVVLVENGKEAVEESRRSDFDLILLDMQMPVMDGYTAANQMRAEGISKPIVALTAHAMRGDEERCIEAGCSEYLTKPIRHDLLLARIVELVSAESIVESEKQDQLLSDDHEFLVSELPVEDSAFAELVRDFIDQAREQIGDFRKARDEHDNEKLAKLAHWIKGAGGMAGFFSLTESAMALEASVEDADQEAIEAGVLRLERLVQRLQSPA
jgi:CheY-like chemotaxis protein/HPt (histidine-containing phosphotransfer) domain-containing protein